jgi:hypothetical protein
MFTERLSNRDASVPAHVARMIALMGLPPKNFWVGGILRQCFSTLLVYTRKM